MNRRGVTLFRLLGIPVRLDPTWLVLALLVTWTLAEGLFGPRYPELSEAVHWLMALVATLGLFASIVFHEMSHSLVARHYRLSIRGITLFIFGGVSEMEEDPKSPKAEFQIAAAGPLASFVLAACFWGLYEVLPATGSWWTPVGGLVLYLAQINALLGVFNLLPGFPLDGGRVLRAGLWAWKRDLGRASRIAAMVGSGFGMTMILLGIVTFILGGFVAGIWWFLIGSFLRQAAHSSYRQVLLRRAFEGMPIKRFLKADPVTISPDVAVSEFVEECLLRHQYRMYPVVENDRLLGLVTVKDVKKLDRDEWPNRRVRDLVQAPDGRNSVAPDQPAYEVLQEMMRGGPSRLLVREDERLVGIVTLRDLLRFFALRMELEEESEAPAEAVEEGAPVAGV